MRHLGIVLFLLLALSGKSQQSSLKGFMQLSGPEKAWVVGHPLKAKKAWRITQRARGLTDSIAPDPRLDGDAAGGEVDAFRHICWMALLSQNIGQRAARKLGEAHEKGNYRTFKKGKLEDGSTADEAASEMDLNNNRLGLEIGLCDECTEEQIVGKVIARIEEGRVYVIRKDSQGRALDMDGMVIPDADWRGKWQNNRCVVFNGSMP